MEDGLTLKFRKREITFYPINLRMMRTMPEQIQELLTVGTMKEAFSAARAEKLAPLFTASAKIGDPSITQDEIEDFVHVRHWPDLIRFLIGVEFKKEDGESPKALSPPTGE